LGYEHDNLRAVLSWLLKRGDAEGAAQLGWDLKWFWYIRGHLAEGQRWMERALAHGQTLPPSSRAKAVTVAAALAVPQGDLDQTAALAEEGVRLARRAGDREVLAAALHVGGYAAVSRGEYAHAATLADESVALHRALDDPSGTGLAMTVLVHVAIAEGDFVRAQWLLDESEELLRTAGSLWNLTVNLNIRATATAMSGDPTQAVTLLQESLALALRLRDTQTVVYGLEALASALAMLGQDRRAARLFGATEALRERTGSAIGTTPFRKLRERYLALLHAQLEAEELAAAWAEGRAMTFEEAVEYALEPDEAPPTTPP
jgi:non-specific serine/threonine protein kinase